MCHHNVACHEVGSDVSILTPHTCRRYVVGCRWKNFPIDQIRPPRAVSSQRLHPASNLEDLLPRVHRQVGLRLHLRRLPRLAPKGPPPAWPRGRRQAGQVPEALPSLTLLEQILCEGPGAASHLLGGRLTSEGSEALIGARMATPGCIALHYNVRKSGARAWAAWVTHRVALFREHLNIGSHVTCRMSMDHTLGHTCLHRDVHSKLLARPKKHF